MAKLSGFSMRHDDVDTTQKEGGGLPDGHYRFEVDESADKPHHDNRDGYKIDLVLEVIEPEEFKGRKIFLDFGVVDPDNPWNGEAENWARQDFGKFLKAIDFNDEFDDPDDLIGRSGIVRYSLDRKRSDKQNKRYGKVWGYVYPEDERDWLEKNEIGPSARQEEWFPAKQSQSGDRGRSRDDRGSRGSRDGGREDRGSSRGGRDDRGSRDDRGRDNDRERSRDRDDRGGRDSRDNRDARGNEDDDIPFNEGRDGGQSEGGSDRPSRGGGSNPWNRGRR